MIVTITVESRNLGTVEVQRETPDFLRGDTRHELEKLLDEATDQVKNAYKEKAYGRTV